MKILRAVCTKWDEEAMEDAVTDVEPKQFGLGGEFDVDSLTVEMLFASFCGQMCV